MGMFECFKKKKPKIHIKNSKMEKLKDDNVNKIEINVSINQTTNNFQANSSINSSINSSTATNERTH